MLISNMMGHLSANLASMARYQTMASTGKLIQKASEDPVVAARTLKLNTDISVLSQYKKNADSAVAWMETTETAIGSINVQLVNIRTRIVQASNGGTLAEEDRQYIASLVKQLRDEIISLANTTYSGRYIFSGYKSDTPLMDQNGFFNTVVSQLEKIQYEVGVTNKLQVNVTGDSLFNLGQPVGYLPARSALVQDIDDVLAMLDAKATVVSSVPLNLNSPGVFDMTNVSVNVTLGTGAPVTINFNDANVQYVNRMTGAQVIDYINKKIGLGGTASLDKNGNIELRSHQGAGVSVTDAAGAAGSAAKLFGGAPGVPVTNAGAKLTGSKSMTEPIVDVSAFKPFQIIVDRSSDPLKIDLSVSTTINDRRNARPDEIAREINKQIADQIAAAALVIPPAIAPDLKWVKCTYEDGRLCLTSESFGFQSFIEISGDQEIYDLFGVTPSHKQGNIEQQGKLIGSRDFREPVTDVTLFRDPITGEAPTIRIVINGVFLANIQLDDGDAAIDPKNMTLRQIMRKIDDQLGMHGTCDIDEGRLVIRASDGGPNSSIELAGIDQAFYEFLFGSDPIVKNGANEPTHGYYKGGVAFKLSEDVVLPAGFAMDVIINSTVKDPVTGQPLTLNVGGFPATVGTPPATPKITDIVDHINKAYLDNPATAININPTDLNNYSFATLVDGNGNQIYPPLYGAQMPEENAEVYLKFQSHTWGTGSNIKIVNTAPPSAGYDAGMQALFGKGTINAPVAMGGVDGFDEEICAWLDVADAQLANINQIWTDLGARMSRGELTQDRLELDKIVADTLLAENESVDEAKAIMLLRIAETVYSASLAVGARVIQPSLLDFLR